MRSLSMCKLGGWIDPVLSGGLRVTAVSLAFALLASGCGSHTDDVSHSMRDYRERVLRLLDIDPAELPADVSRPLPNVLRKRDVLVPIGVESVGLLEFFELQQCDLGSLVGQRSGSLGKLAPLSERLIYELAFLRLAEDCLSSNDALPADARELISEIVKGKRSNLDGHLWNAIFAGPEMLRRLGSADGNLSEFATQLTDLRDLTRLAMATREGGPRWSDALESLAAGGGIGAAVERWRVVDHELGLVVSALRHSGGDVCRNGRPTPRARHLKALLEEFFVARVRAKLAVHLQTDESWVRSMNALAEDFNNVAPPAFDRWRAQILSGDESSWQRSQHRLREHATSWAALLEGCGLGIAPAPANSSQERS